jgi:fructokinase
MGLLAGIEGGGTKFVTAVARMSDSDEPELVTPEFVTKTTSEPAAMVSEIVAFLKRTCQDHGPLDALGVATFGPLDLNKSSDTYGCLTTTPKPGWAGFDLLGSLRRGLETDGQTLPIGFDTDVNGAALGEWRWGAARRHNPAVYITVGTGIGGGAIISGAPLHGASHPEMGHLKVPRYPGDEFAGACPTHRDCLEGLAAAPAIRQRWNMPPADIPDDHPAWEAEAHYLAQGLRVITLVLSPQIVVLGGGVMQRKGLLQAVGERLDEALDGYVPAPELVPPHFGMRAGLIGALALAEPVPLP